MHGEVFHLEKENPPVGKTSRMGGLYLSLRDPMFKAR